MKGRFYLYKKCIISIVLATTMIPLNVYGATYNPVIGGAAGIGRNSDGTLNLTYSSTDDSTSENTTSDTTLSLEIPSTVTRDLSGAVMEGVYVGDVDISGLNYDQAVKKIQDYVATFSDGDIVLESVNGAKEAITAGDLGITWNDTDTLADALSLGKSGNIVERYKEKKDIQHEKKVYDLKLSFDEEAVREIVEKQAELYNIEPVSGELTREGGQFKITPGVTGYVVEVDESVNKIMSEMSSYKGGAKMISLSVTESNPHGTTEDLEKVKDLLGSFTTSFSSSGSDRSGNVRNGTRLINGTLLLPGEQFSTYETVSPFTEENGYYMAGSYLNGMVVESLGGGICQVSSTLYNAVIRAELQVDERYNHSMIVTYVKMSSDAAISGTSKDFKFTNSTDYPIYIEGYTTDDKQVVFNIYGVETRPSNRTLEFESVELSKTELEEEKIVTDPSQPLGYISTQAAHTGYSGEFYKIVKVDGVETERIRLNKSYYQATPKTATVGTATDNAAALAALQTAIATGSIDYVKSTISSLNSAAAAAAAGGL